MRLRRPTATLLDRFAVEYPRINVDRQKVAPRNVGHDKDASPRFRVTRRLCSRLACLHPRVAARDKSVFADFECLVTFFRFRAGWEAHDFQIERTRRDPRCCYATS